ncbi:MAG: hypothetical protein IIT53_06925, partial [Fibrobacter sp.]|nr:hypothetical protein [Fibrobacter sp.]
RVKQNLIDIPKTSPKVWAASELPMFLDGKYRLPALQSLGTINIISGWWLVISGWWKCGGIVREMCENLVNERSESTIGSY